jgi:hypothetical protein
MELLGLGFRTVDDLIEVYTARRVMGLKKRGRQVKVPVETKLPAGCGPLQQPHRNYLRHRGFNDHRLEADWGIQGTGPIGQYKFRIIAPIYLDGRLISYQGRDITGRQDLPYKACTREQEALHHKHSLYGIDKVPGDRALVVEGLFDVWRMGPGAIAPFGIEYTEEQVLMMADRLRHVHILFDPEEQAQRQADKMAIDLMQYGVEVDLLNLTERDDPADMTPAEALSLMGSLGIQM